PSSGACHNTCPPLRAKLSWHSRLSSLGHPVSTDADRRTFLRDPAKVSSTIQPKEIVMSALLKTGMIVVMLTALPVAAGAGTLEGVAIGAGTGALVAGPPGAVVGG